jgi:hypothetical protein
MVGGSMIIAWLQHHGYDFASLREGAKIWHIRCVYDVDKNNSVDMTMTIVSQSHALYLRRFSQSQH